eukprot:4519832-Pleurochrysis_carterae.AAC.1
MARCPTYRALPTHVSRSLISGYLSHPGNVRRRCSSLHAPSVALRRSLAEATIGAYGRRAT